MLLPGQGLRGRLPLLSPAFRHSILRRQVRLHDARDPSSEGWTRILSCKFSRNDDFHAIFGNFYMPQITTWGRRLYFLSEGRHAEDFFALKIRRLRPGLNPPTRVPEVARLPLDHGSRSKGYIEMKYEMQIPVAVRSSSRSAAVWLVGWRVRIPLRVWMFVISYLLCAV